MQGNYSRGDYPGETGPELEHSVHIKNREETVIEGVLHVDSFDDEEIILDTEHGGLVLRGENLHIKQLDLETGRFQVEGLLQSLQYSAGTRGRNGKGRPKGLFERLLR